MDNLKKIIGIGTVSLLSLLGTWKATELVSKPFEKQEPEYFLHIARFSDGDLGIRLDSKQDTVYFNSGLYSYDPKVKIINESPREFLKYRRER